jgi:hypothetical protein
MAPPNAAATTQIVASADNVRHSWRMRRTLVAIASIVASAPSGSSAATLGHDLRAVVTQDPPVIPHPLLKRPSSRPQRFVRTELFFGTAAPGSAVTQEQFMAFLDEEVSPRFPDGLTLFKGHGRFTGDDGALVKEEPFVVILLHPAQGFTVNNRKIETFAGSTSVSSIRNRCCAWTTSSASGSLSDGDSDRGSDEGSDGGSDEGSDGGSVRSRTRIVRGRTATPSPRVSSLTLNPAQLDV